jgi:hypothetical protein
MGLTLRRPQVPHVTLNTDGKRHPRENAATGATVLLGTLAFTCAFFPGLHVPGSWLGLLGMVVGFYAQYISATTAERFLNVIFLGAAFIGFGVSMGNGGFV